ncbi:TPA: Crp/Fnr family transcriptional regulator [Vibrio vulnificus]|nr:Crp/Fnr family transcriptional regulator [Vibrio vulnificus]ELL0586070.1 Crp/Fnr family transcriptional regulator [Vibrio vulnificus]MCU8177946.1 Crp/Fnr family transcriptional regulator [Vibrio vulnificus]MCU8331934.1 Crp/Fnr family transcriptional regulator [Vibrio vulnificus]MCU8410823.1 Crp/Fnr family transcriptional regulator [Vibrio vulnificus]
MDTRFTQQLQQLNLSADDIALVLSHAKELQLPTRHILHHQGEYPQQFYFLLDGLCHACYLTEEGKEFSKEFYWEVDWMIGFESAILQQASPFLLETLTPVHLLTFPIELLQHWRSTHHPLYTHLLETQLIYKERKERFLLLHTPEQKYHLFKTSFPTLLERLSDRQIAAYLGITPVSLSRIKNRSTV